MSARLRILVLDDDRERHNWFERAYADHEVWHVYNVEDLRKRMNQLPRFDLVQLDHDLGESENGLRAADFIATVLEERKRPLKCVVHSWNPSGAQRMLRSLLDGGLLAVYQPFGGRS